MKIMPAKTQYPPSKTHYFPRIPVLSKEAFFSPMRGVTSFTSLGSFASRWIQLLSSSEKIKKPLSSSNANMKTFSQSFTLSQVIEKFEKIYLSIKSLALALFKSKKPSHVDLTKKTLIVVSDLSSGIASVSKTIIVSDSMFTMGRGISQASRLALGDAAMYTGLVGSTVDLISCCWSVAELYKPANVSEMKKKKIELKKAEMKLTLFSKVSSVTAGVLGCAFIAASPAALPWVVLSLTTVSFVISFTKKTRQAISNPRVPMAQRLALVK